LVGLAMIVTIGLSVQTRINQTQDRRTMAPIGAEFVSAGDTQILVQRVGNRKAPAVLFVHGTGSWSETWRPSMDQVAQLGLQAIAIDLPPFGYSLHPASGDYSKQAQARRILAALDALGISEAIFVGHSFGAAPLTEAVLSSPRHARGLILIDAALGLQTPISSGDSTVQSMLRARWLSEALSAAFLTNPAFTKTLLRSFISEKERATDQWVSLYKRPLYLHDTYQGVAAWLPELLAGRGSAASDDPAAFAALKIPVTLIWGETDTITPLSQATYIKQLIPGSMLIVLPRAGHIPQIEEAEEFRTALTRALTNR